jgi:hypothetical protein
VIRSTLAACAAIPLLVLTASNSLGMTYEPFPYCTETSQVDSLVDRVWIDESLIPENAPYRGYIRYNYHPGSCIPSRLIQRPHYLDLELVFDYTLRADRRSVDYTLGEGDRAMHGRAWFSADGELDSSTLSSPGPDEAPGDSTHHIERHFRTPRYQVITQSSRRGTGPWTVWGRDSIVTSGSITTIHTEEDEEAYVTRCSQEGTTFVCVPTPVGAVITWLDKKVWHLTGSRVDSLRTYKLDGRLESVRYYHWSPRGSIAVRKTRKPLPGARRPGLRPGYRWDGRRLVNP